MENNLSFSKIVATPTLNSWSQAYNAGKLFAVLSLETTPESQEIESLNMLGKDLLERLEQEFFAIEEKNLETIKSAVSVVFANTPAGATISFAAGAFVGNILYLFGLGKAKVFIKRGDNLGLALNAENTDAKEVTSSSGFIKEKDRIVIATAAFSDVITQDELAAGIDGFEPAEITESLAPKIHKAENGKISAIVIKYQTPLPDPLTAQDDLSEGLQEADVIEQDGTINETEEIQEKTPLRASFAEAATKAEQGSEGQAEKPTLLKKYLALFKAKSTGWWKKPNFKIKLSKKLFLIAALIIVAILISSIFLTINEQNNAKIRTLFAQIYPEAQKKYEEGQGLAEINRIYARDSFLAAQKILNDNKDKFPAKSKESIQTQDLLTKITTGLSLVSPIDKSGLDRSALSVAVLNGSGMEGIAARGANILKGFGYTVASTGNADNFNYVGLTIKVKSEQSKFLNLLKQDLSKDYTITASSADLPADSPTPALIIIGK